MRPLGPSGRLVRAQVTAHNVHEAIDLLKERIRRRLDRLARHWEGRHGGPPSGAPHEWRHGQESNPLRRDFTRPAEQRRVVRHKAYELIRTTPDEAVFDLDLMERL